MAESARLKADLTRLYALVDALRRKLGHDYTQLGADIQALADAVAELPTGGGGGGGPPYDGADIIDGTVKWVELDPEVDRIYSVDFNPDQVEGTTDGLVGVVWLEAGTASYVIVNMGCTDTGDTATLKLYRQSTDDLLHTFTVAGALGYDTTTGLTIPASENYEFRGHNSTAEQVAIFKSAAIKARP